MQYSRHKHFPCDRNTIYLFTFVIHCIYLLIHCTVTNQHSVFVCKTPLFITGEKIKLTSYNTHTYCGVFPYFM